MNKNTPRASEQGLEKIRLERLERIAMLARILIEELFAEGVSLPGEVDTLDDALKEFEDVEDGKPKRCHTCGKEIKTVRWAMDGFIFCSGACAETRIKK
jgi:hypothetical protein